MPGPFDDLIEAHSEAAPSGGPFDDLIAEHSTEDVGRRLKEDQDFEPTPEQAKAGYDARYTLPDLSAALPAAKDFFTKTIPDLGRKAVEQIPGTLTESVNQFGALGGPNAALTATAAEALLQGTYQLGSMLTPPLRSAADELAAEMQDPKRAFVRNALQAIPGLSWLTPAVQAAVPRSPQQEAAAVGSWVDRTKAAGEEQRAMAPALEGRESFLPGANPAAAALAGNVIDPTLLIPAAKAAGLLSAPLRAGAKAGVQATLEQVAKNAADKGGAVRAAVAAAAPVVEGAAEKAGTAAGTVGKVVDTIQPVLDVAGLVKGGLPGAAGAHVAGRAASAGLKWAKKVGEAATGLRNVAAADWNSAFPVYAQLAKDADAPVWLKRAASSAVAPAVEATLKTGGAIGEGALHGAGIGTAAGAANDTMTPEEKGGAIGVGGAFGAFGAALGRATSKGARVEAAQAHDIAVRMQKTLDAGTDPVAVLGASDSTMYYADNVEKLFKGAMPGGKDLEVRLLDPKQFAEANPDEPGAVAYYRQTPDGRYEAAINLAEGGGDARLLHEALGHALIDSVVGSNQDAVARIKAVYSPELLQQASEQYAKALKPDATPEEVAAYVQSRREASQAAHSDPDAWIAAELFAEAAVQKFAGMDLLKMATPGFLGRLSRRLRTADALPKVSEAAEKAEVKSRSGQKFDVSKGTFFRDEVASKLSDPNLAEDLTQRVRDLGSYRPGVDATIEPAVKVKPTDWGKAPHAPLHDLPGGAKGTDFVVQKPDGTVIERTPKQVRTIVKNRVREIDAAVPKDGVPAPAADADPMVKLRRTVSGMVERAGTKLGDWFYKGNVFSETTKAFARTIEAAIEAGEALAGWYHQIGESSPDWKQSVAREFGNLSAQYKDFVPIGFSIPKKGNLLVRNYSLTAFERKAAQWSGRKGPASLELWNGDVGQFRDDVKVYLKNHAEGRPGADGIGEAKRNVINAFMVGANRTFETANPLRVSLKGEDKQGLVRSYRLDRLETLEPSQVTGFNQPKYEKQVKNLSPKVADDRTSGVAFKNFFSDVTKGAEKYRPQTPWKSLIPLDDQEAFVREYDKHTGNFDNHIATSIPGYKDVQVRKGAAIVAALPEGGRMLDVGASEGSFAKTVSALSGGKIETVALDPNPDMAKFFREKSTVPRSSYVEEAFLNGFEDGGKEVPAYAPDKPFDVIHEAMVFQFISKEREAQVAEVKRMLGPEGVFLTEEKVLTPPDVWKANELKKDKEFKNNYYSDEKLAAKQAVVKFQQDPNETRAVGMVDNMVSDRDFEALLQKTFKHVVQYWDSGNFKGYAASDSPVKLQKIVDGMGDLNTKFSTEETPRKVASSTEFSPAAPVLDVQKARDEYARASGRPYVRRRGAPLVFDETVAKKIADFHDAAESHKLDRKTAESYAAWNRETEAQFKHLQSAGYVMEPWEKAGEPYKTSADLVSDLRDNKHMFYLKSESALGDGEGAGNSYPPLELSSVSLGNPPSRVPYNDLFRAVHDVFGHGSEGHNFTKDGEYRAWDEHSALYSEKAQAALALETLAYNAWFNAGAHLRRPDGSLPRKGEKDFVPLNQRGYAPRKTYTLPPELIAEATPGREAAPAAQFSPAASTDSPEFKKWFKGSMFQKDGKPEVWYHGTGDGGFTQFGTTRRLGRPGEAAFFTNDERMASTYSGSRREVDLSLPDAERIVKDKAYADEHGFEIFRDPTSGNIEVYHNGELHGTLHAVESSRQKTPFSKEQVEQKAIEYVKGILPESEPVQGQGGLYHVFVSLTPDEVAELDWGGHPWGDHPEYGTTDDAVVSYSKAGARALLMRNVSDPGPYSRGEESGDVLAVMDPDGVVKSATQNKGTFDPKNPDIRFSPSTSFWLTPDGKKVSFGEGEFSHSDVADRVFKGHPNPLQKAFDSGWVRVAGMGQDLYANTPGKLTPAQRRELVNTAIENKKASITLDTDEEYRQIWTDNLFSPKAETKDPYVMEETKRGRFVVKDSRTGEVVGPKNGYKESYEARSAMLLKNQTARAMASEEKAALGRKGAATTSKTPPTGWILPSGEYIGAEDATGAFQNTGDWHLGQLQKNAEDFKKRFGLTGTGEDARFGAVKKGFVRVRLDGASGRLGIEALAPLKPATKQKILDIVESNSGRISKVDLNLFNRAGKVVGGGSESLFKEDAQGKRAAVEAMFSPKVPDSPEFKKWFAGSKVVDGSGQPLVVYHGTSNAEGFSKMRPLFRDAVKNEDPNSWTDSTLGHFFAGDPSVAGKFAEEATVPAFLKITKPYRVSGERFYKMLDTWTLPKYEKLKVRLTADGYDGIVVAKDPTIDQKHGPGWSQFDADTYIAFSGKQVRGVFSDKFSPKVSGPERSSESRKVTAFFKTNEAAKLVQDATDGSGPFDGGCLICAKALQRAFDGGDIIHLQSAPGGKPQAEHYGLKLPDGRVADGRGIYPSESDWKTHFAKEEAVHRPMTVESGVLEDSVDSPPDDPAAVRKLAAGLQKFGIGPAFSPKVTAPVPAPEFTTSVPGVARSAPIKPEEKGSPIRYANLNLPKRSTSGTKIVLEDAEARPRFFDRLTKEQEKVANDPARLGDPKGYAEYMRNAGVYGDIMTAPPGLRDLVNDPAGYVKNVEGGYHEDLTKPGTKEAAIAGLDSTVEMRKLIRGPSDGVAAGPPPLVAAMHHFWGILSRQLPPVQQEAAWLRLVSRPEVLAQIQKSIDGTYDLTNEQWSALVSAGMKETAQGDNKMGNQGTSNANAFHLMLARWNGAWDKVSDVYAAPNSIEMGRRFWSLDRGPVGIKNKVQRFIGLTYGIPGLLMDRWKFVELYMGQYKTKPRDYFDYSATGTPSDPNGIYGAYGPIENGDPTLSLAFYEGLETALQKAIDSSSELKTMLGAHANVGGLHWMGWNAIKNEAVGHSSLGLTYDLLKESTNPTPEDVLKLIEAGDYYTEGLDGNTLKRFSLNNSKK